MLTATGLVRWHSGHMPRRPHIAPKDFPRPAPREYAGTRADAARWVRDTLRGQILEGAYGGLSAARPALHRKPSSPPSWVSAATPSAKRWNCYAAKA